MRDVLDPTDVVGDYAVQEINMQFWPAQGRKDRNGLQSRGRIDWYRPAALGTRSTPAAWLVHTPAERGEPLKAGDVLLAGALGPVVTLTPGDTVETRIQGIGSCSFTYGDEV
jgi:2-keto-4-pentenoate hydratase